MTDVMTKATIRRLASAYEHVDDIDLFTGGLSERPVVGGVVGPTFACILGQQFLNLRKGDRFWYENGGADGQFPGGFTPDQLQEIRRSSLARVICNGLDDVGAIQPYAFLADDEFANRRSSCKGSRIPRVNLTKWKEDENNARPTLFSAAPTLYSVLALPTSQNEFGLNKLSEMSPTKYSPLTFLQDKFPFDYPASSQDEEVDKIFALWLKNKDITQNLAVSPNSSSALDDNIGQNIFINEVPKPITREQYFNVFRSGTDEENIGENDISLDFVINGNGRSSKEKYSFNDKQGTGNDNFDAFVDDLFRSARREAFDEKELFYRK